MYGYIQPYPMMGGYPMQPTIIQGGMFNPGMIQTGSMMGGMTQVGLTQPNLSNSTNVDMLLAR